MKREIKRKKLGQHFLKNIKILRILATSLGDIHNETIIEIGGGHGELTQFLTLAKKLIVYEIDPKLAEVLKTKFEGIEVKNEDFLKSNLEKYKHNYILVGNIPYSITGLIIRKIFSIKNYPKVALLTLQKEYGEKILAKNGNNFLHSWIKIWCEVKKILIIKKKYFRPQPKVDSIALKFDFYKKPLINEIDDYENFLKLLFKAPNKNIKNNLKDFYFDENFADKKPRNLTFEEVIHLFKSLKMKIL